MEIGPRDSGRGSVIITISHDSCSSSASLKLHCSLDCSTPSCKVHTVLMVAWSISLDAFFVNPLSHSQLTLTRACSVPKGARMYTRSVTPIIAEYEYPLEKVSERPARYGKQSQRKSSKTVPNGCKRWVYIAALHYDRDEAIQDSCLLELLHPRWASTFRNYLPCNRARIRRACGVDNLSHVQI
jgi:hypothetical protein